MSNTPSIPPTMSVSTPPSIPPTMSVSTPPSIPPSIPPSMPPSIPPTMSVSIPPSIPPSMSVSTPPSMSPSMFPSIPPYRPYIPPSMPPSMSSSSTRYIPPTVIPSNPPEDKCNCPNATPSVPITTCDYTNISYNTGSMIDCLCPSDNQLKITNNLYASFNRKKSGNGTYNVRTNMCEINNTKYIITDENNVYKETICVDNQYNSKTGGSVRKYWCSNN